MSINRGTILIVDDNPTNLDVLFDYLDEAGFEVFVAEDGHSAIEQVGYAKPDIILLDVMMPGIDGFETCRQLKDHPQAKTIPVIFMTALSDASHKVTGFQVGAVDYVTKPIQYEEVLARVNTHLTISQLQHQLQLANTELEQRYEATQLQLIEAEKMAALGNLVAGVTHEINTPIGIGVSMASLLAHKTDEILATFKTGKIKLAVLKEYLQTASESSTLMLNNLRRAADLVQSLKIIAVDQTSKDRRTFEVKSYLDEILRNLGHLMKRTSHTIVIDGPAQLSLNSYPGAFSQVISNLLLNSLKHAYRDNEAGHITISFSQQGDELMIAYQDDGCGISPENLPKIFDPFFTTARDRGGSGLGLNIIRELVTETLQGTICCESQVGQGTKFVIQIPVDVNQTSEVM